MKKSRNDYSGGKIHQKIQKQCRQEHEAIKGVFKPQPIKCFVDIEQYDIICDIHSLEVKIALEQERLKELKKKAKELKVTQKMTKDVRWSRMH